MLANKLGRYIASPEFLERANAAITAAVYDLLANGIRPAYLDRSTGKTTVGGIDIDIDDPVARGVLSELLTHERRELRLRVVAFAKEEGRARLVGDAVHAVASALLLAKTAMPHEQACFMAVVSEQMAHIRPHPVLVEVARVMIEAGQNTYDDIFRDRNIIGDALFDQRLKVIRQALRY